MGGIILSHQPVTSFSDTERFKSDNGADAFCQLHPIVHTARKNGQNPFKALIAVAENITVDSS
jgi:hypothetical protein